MKVVVVVGFHTGSGGGGVFGRALRAEADEYGYESGHEPHAPLPEECYRACLWEREELGWANHRKGE